MSDNNTDSIPEKDMGELKGRIKNPKITRDETEDRLLSLTEENVVLKKHLRKQEDRIKQLATKLVRVIGERSNRGKREDNILVEDQKCRIVELEAQVRNLRDKLLVARQQLGSYTKLVPGLHKQGVTKSKSIRSVSSGGHPEGHLLLPDQVTRLLLEAKSENHALQNQLKILHKRWTGTQQELLAMKEQLNLKEVEQEDEMLALRTQMESEHDTNKNKLADNIQLIRLQRDSKRTASWLATYEAQCRTLETSLNSANESLQQVESQLSSTQQELRDEQTRSLNLLKQVEDTTSFQHQLKELETQIVALQDENQILKQSNDSLVSKALESTERVRRVESQDDSAKTQNSHLENTIRTELQAKSELISALSQEKSKCLSLEQALQNARQESHSVTKQLEAVEQKLNDLEVIDKETRKIGRFSIGDTCDKCVTLEIENSQIQWQLLQVRDELVKTKNLLKTQISINKEYHKEIDVLSSKLEKAEVFHNKKLKEFMKIFEEKTSQMSLLEKSIESFNTRVRTPPHAFISYENPEPKATAQAHTQTDKPEPSPIQVPPANNPVPAPKPLPEPSPVRTSPNSPVPESSLLPASNTVLAPITNLKLNPEAHTFASGIALPLVEKSNTSEPDPQLPLKIAPTVYEKLDSNDAKPVAQIKEVSKPTLNIEIERFIPRNEEMLPTLFLTWEHPDLPRKYSPIVSNGIFNSTSSHTLPTDFKVGKLTVELHQAIGPSDCRTIGNGVLAYDDGVIPIFNTETGEVLGQLIYSCQFNNFKLPDINENVEVQQKVLVTRPPVPVPRKIKPPEHIESKPEDGRAKAQPAKRIKVQVSASVPVQSAAMEVVPATHPASPAKQQMSAVTGKPPQKSILRKERPASPRSASRHVTVNETIEERQFESGFDTESYSSAPSSPDDLPKVNYAQISVDVVVEPQPTGSTAMDASEDQSSDSQSSKRKARRRNAEDAETDVSMTSVGSETSRNISELEDEDTEIPDCAMRIEISYVVFSQNCKIWNDSRIKRFYVEYRFLNYAAQDLETEVSLPKPQPGRKAEFNWVKVFAIDTKEKRRLLKDMLRNNTRVEFTLVSEPGNDDALDCEDIGYAYVSMSDILQDDADIVEEEIVIYDAENTRVEIGVMCVSVQALIALKSL